VLQPCLVCCCNLKSDICSVKPTSSSWPCCRNIRPTNASCANQQRTVNKSLATKVHITTSRRTSASPLCPRSNCNCIVFYLTMPPTLVLIRHAQAEHNATNDWSIHDPPLTQLGEQQSRELQESLKQSDIGNQVELIVVSAQRRTLQTATIGLDWLIKKGVPGMFHLGRGNNVTRPSYEPAGQHGLT